MNRHTLTSHALAVLLALTAGGALAQTGGGLTRADGAGAGLNPNPASPASAAADQKAYANDAAHRAIKRTHKKTHRTATPHASTQGGRSGPVPNGGDLTDGGLPSPAAGVTGSGTAGGIGNGTTSMGSSTGAGAGTQGSSGTGTTGKTVAPGVGGPVNNNAAGSNAGTTSSAGGGSGGSGNGLGR